MDGEEFNTLQQRGKSVPKSSRPRKSHKKPDVDECQPTSSNVKVEDMITDDQEEIPENQDNTTTS